MELARRLSRRTALAGVSGSLILTLTGCPGPVPTVTPNDFQIVDQLIDALANIAEAAVPSQAANIKQYVASLDYFFKAFAPTPIMTGQNQNQNTTVSAYLNEIVQFLLLVDNIMSIVMPQFALALQIAAAILRLLPVIASAFGLPTPPVPSPPTAPTPAVAAAAVVPSFITQAKAQASVISEATARNMLASLRMQ